MLIFTIRFELFKNDLSRNTYFITCLKTFTIKRKFLIKINHKKWLFFYKLIHQIFNINKILYVLYIYNLSILGIINLQKFESTNKKIIIIFHRYYYEK